MIEGTHMGYFSSLYSHQKTRWDSGSNHLSDHYPAGAGAGAASFPSLNPSKLLLFSLPGAGVPFSFRNPSEVAPSHPPDYGFHMLERRRIELVDGSIRSYFALPPEYQELPSGTNGHGPELGNPDLGFDKSFNSGCSLSPEGFGRDGVEMYGSDDRGNLALEGSLKRKYGDEDERDWRDGGDEFARRKQKLLQFGNPSSNLNCVPSDSGDGAEYMVGESSPVSQNSMDSGSEIDDLRSLKHKGFEGDYDDLYSLEDVPGDDVSFKHPDVNHDALKKAFFGYAKSINEDASQRKNYLEDGKHGPLKCLACGRASKDFPDMHGLIMHAYNSQNADLRVDHLGLHKALCVLMGWNYVKPPDNSKAYQSLSSEEAMANKDDLIMWPPLVIIRNTNTRRKLDGIMKGMQNKDVNIKIRDLGFDGGRSKNLYGKDGDHLGITLVRFTGDDPSGLNTAIRLAEFFEKDKHGRREWSHVQISQLDKDDESNPLLFKVGKKAGKKERVLYGYLGTASDLDQVNLYTRETAVIISRREKLSLK